MNASEGAEQAEAKLSEALEYVERARGHLYDFHQLTGHADLLLDEVLEALGEAEREDLAETIRRRIYGLDVLFGRWTFEVVEEFDEGYYAAWRSVEEQVRNALTGGKRHSYEAQMKLERQAKGVKSEKSGEFGKSGAEG